MAPSHSTEKDGVPEIDRLSPLGPDAEFERKKKKALDDLGKDRDRTRSELEANEIFGDALTSSNWKPGGRQLQLIYRRQSSGATSALTASKMSRENMKDLAWFFTENHVKIQKNPKNPPRGVASDIQEALNEMQEEMRPIQPSLPNILKITSATSLHLNSSDKKHSIPTQLRRLSNAISILFSQGKLPDPTTKDSTGLYKPQNPCDIEWSADPASLTAYELANEKALGVLFNLSLVTKASSELVVERSMGSFLQHIFEGIGANTETTSGQTLHIFGALSAFGTHPQPDILTRATKSPHRLLQPACLIGEAKTEQTWGPNSVAQLATAVHSTLVLLVIAFCLDEPPRPIDFLKLPAWAVLFGITYTEHRVIVHAFHPHTGSGSSDARWQFGAVKMYEFKGIMDATVQEKLKFMHAMGDIQRRAREFGNNMSALLERVFVFGNGELRIKPGVMNKHPTDKEKLSRLSDSLANSMKEWERISP